ncbi:MAG: class I SAM-dependent methyltransferase [Candidatus Melainabacteria bacterium]|nr:class I SAM-dependent methyltransferase [Candidatus Melainabacteria bacterium]
MKVGIKKVEVCCNNCGSRASSLVTEGVEHEYKNTTSDIFRVVKCHDCGLVYLNPRPDISELSTIYPSEYYAYHLAEKNVEKENTNSLLYRARRNVYLSRLERALSLSAQKGSLKVLDIGCADGRALNWYKQVRCANVETFGVDFDEKAVQLARNAGHTVYFGRFEEACIPEQFFDLVVATHVIEHVADPTAFAQRAFEVLKPGGIFLIETPNIEAFDARWFKNRHWGGYHFPRHWIFYSPATLKRLVEARGFTIVETHFHPAPAFWNWTMHSLIGSADRQKNGFFSRLADRLFPPAEFQKNSLRNLLFVSAFTLLDIALKAATGSTSNMSMTVRKPI